MQAHVRVYEDDRVEGEVHTPVVRVEIVFEGASEDEKKLIVENSMQLAQTINESIERAFDRRLRELEKEYPLPPPIR